MKLLKYAAIDIGSNAARLLVAAVLEDEKPHFKKSSLVRVPLRLGFEAFTKGEISTKNVDRIVHTMEAYAHLMKAHEVTAYRACATSAMREASNGSEIVERVLEKTGINLEIIGGDQEAEILHEMQMKDKLEADVPYLYVDVGGGSTEVTLIYNEETIVSKSFNIGTIRLLENQISSEIWEEMASWVVANTKSFDDIVLIGTGGNINKLFKLSGQKMGTIISRKRLDEVHTEIKELSFIERIKLMNMKADRADVIVPAGNIYLTIMKAAESKKMLVPKIGLADGIIRFLYKIRNG